MTYSIIDSLEIAFTELWVMLLHFAPLLLAAVIILVVGLVVSGVLKKVTRKVFAALRVNDALATAGLDTVVARAGYKLDAGYFVGTLVKWFVMLVFLIVALDIMRLTEVTTFIREVVIGYFPRVIVAVLILMVAAIVAGFARSATVAAATAAQMNRPELFGKVAYGAILLFAALAALNQLQIAQELVQMFFAGMVFAIALALGLAFGFGGRDTAARYLDSVTKR